MGKHKLGNALVQPLCMWHRLAQQPSMWHKLVQPLCMWSTPVQPLCMWSRPVQHALHNHNHNHQLCSHRNYQLCSRCSLQLCSHCSPQLCNRHSPQLCNHSPQLCSRHSLHLCSRHSLQLCSRHSLQLCSRHKLAQKQMCHMLCKPVPKRMWVLKPPVLPWYTAAQKPVQPVQWLWCNLHTDSTHRALLSLLLTFRMGWHSPLLSHTVQLVQRRQQVQQ